MTEQADPGIRLGDGSSPGDAPPRGRKNHRSRNSAKPREYPAVRDFIARVEALLMEAAECDMIAELAADGEKRALFEQLACDYREMAQVIQEATSHQRSDTVAD